MAQTGKGIRICQYVHTSHYRRIEFAIPKRCTCRLSHGKVVSLRIAVSNASMFKVTTEQKLRNSKDIPEWSLDWMNKLSRCYSLVPQI